MLGVSSTYDLVLLILTFQEMFVESLYVPGTMKDIRGVKYMRPGPCPGVCSQTGMKDT